MRVVLVAVGSRGDVAPMLALAGRLARDGHEPVLISHATLLPDRHEGIELVPVESDPAALLDGPAARALRRGDLRGLNRTRGSFADLLASVAAPTSAALPGADVVVASTFAMAAVTAAREAGVPVVRAQFWPESSGADGPMPALPYAWLLPSPLRRAARAGLRQLEPLLAGFDGWWERGRLRIVSHHRAGFTDADAGVLHAYSREVALPGASDLRGGALVTGWWVDDGEAAVSPATGAVLAEPGAPWVFVGFGSMPQNSAGQLLGITDDACARVGVRALLQTGSLPAGTRGDRVVVVGPEPHTALLRRTAVAVHHGGSGTTAAAVRAGIPSVVVPHVADQFYWGHRLQTVGVAPRLVPRPRLSAEILGARLEQALRPSMRAAARRLGGRVRREDGTGAAVAFLEAAVARRG